MGLFDEVAKLAGQSAAGSSVNTSLMQGVLKMLGSGNGLAGVIEGFTKGGLAKAAQSWVGTGPNQPISADQLQQGLGAERVQQLAKASGLSEGAAAGALAGLLPTVIDKLTPSGGLPDSSELEKLLGSVKNLLGA